MKRLSLRPAICLAALLGLTFSCIGQERLADLLAEPGADLSDPASRQRIVERLRAADEQRRQAAQAKARQLGLPLRVTRPNGATQELADFDGELPVYFTTHNASAAISTGANLVRSAYSVEGAGVTVGVWDGGSARATHQEFGGRVVVKDSSGSIDHATHVAGTIAAAGVVASAKGMAPAAVVDTYDWNTDLSEMTSRGASGAGQAGKIYLSNHSYGYISGWNYVDNLTRVWDWYGDGNSATTTPTATDFEQDFGRYNNYSRDQDALAFNAPYYLIFRSAGNDRGDNPATGEKVALAPGGATVVNYDPALHPKGDGLYRGGFETIGFDALAKNVVSVGSTLDAVNGSGLRDPSLATPSSFSAFGPTDDGRIKPDLVANGEDVYSSLNTSNSTYGRYWGTSMSSPNAAGSAALLVHHYGNLFPGQAMRASTLKGLLIHTADERGNPGPDYRYGWGLVNTKAAADLLSDHALFSAKQRVTENQLTTSTTIRTLTFAWDGSSPIRATLCWTDPAGTATTTSDLRSPRLVNNLNLKLISPTGTEHLPWVMPFVGTWTQTSMNSAATRGINNTDNVEQVLIPSPAVAGAWQAVVSYSGTLANSSQFYSLILNGSTAEEPPPPPLSISAVTPSSGLTGAVTVDLTGSGFQAGTAVKLSRSGQADIQATGEQLIGESLRCQFNLTGAAAGAWNVVATNPDLETATLAGGFTIIGALWAESFDGVVSGWTSQASTGSNAWSVVQTASHSPSSSHFAPGPAAKTTVDLTSPSIPIPANATNLQLGFWHRLSLQSDRDGGKLEFSINGGTWFDVISANSGLSFASNGYNSTIKATGKPAERSEFAGSSAWSGTSSGFINTLVNFTDTAKFAGNNLRLRWRLATDAGTSSPGWWVDSLSLIGGGDISNQAPVIVTAATSSSAETATDPDTTVFQILRGTSSIFTVAGGDDGGEAALTYTWNASGPAAVFFTANSNNAAKTSEGIFEATGDYRVTVAVRDAQGLTSTSAVNVRVVQTSSDVSLSPATASLPVGGTQAFAAALLDQFGQPMASQPSSFAWSTNGGGTINPSGLFTATTAGGPFVISASASGKASTASVTVLPLAATVTLQGLAQTYNDRPRVVTATTSPAGLPVAITYDGSSSAPTDADSYAIAATITNPNYQGSASGTLVIGKATATITLGDLSQPYNRNPRPVSATTAPAGLALVITYDGASTPPAEIGRYPVVATIDEANYQGTAVGELEITGMTYSRWKTSEFTPEQLLAGDGEPGADADVDGLANLAEYAMGTDPNAFTPSPSPLLDPTHLALVFERPLDRLDVTCLAESSDGLGSWSGVTLEETGGTTTYQTLRARVQRPPEGKRLFLRLRFE